MTPWTLVETLRGAGVELAANGGDIGYSGAKGAMTPGLLAELRTLKPAVLALLEAEAEGRRLAAEVERLRAAGQEAAAMELYNSPGYLAAVDRLLDLMETDAPAAELPGLVEVI